jgi:NAD+ synthetase
MRIALAQINPTVGDIARNSEKILQFAADARRQGAAMVVFPELSITGYPPKDLLLKQQFVEDNLRAVKEIAARLPPDLDAVVGYAERNQNPVGRPLHNAVALLRGGRIESRHFKTLLPAYDVFDESRYFEPGPVSETENLVMVGSDDALLTAGLTICEDLWNDEKLIPRRLYHQNPIADLQAAGAQLLINASASPFVVGKHEFRLKLFGSQVKRFGCPLVYVNQVGGNDELVFDGNSCAFDSSGNLIANAKDFEEDLLIVDFDLLARKAGPSARGTEPGRADPIGAQPRDVRRGPQESRTSGPVGSTRPGSVPRADGHSLPIATIHDALVLGLCDYVRKCGFKSVVLGLSGGIDSALTAALAVEALGKDKVVGVAMPSRFSSEHSVNDARELAENLGIEFHIVPIKAVHDAYEQTLAPIFAALPRDVTEENLQARVRGALLMAFSNKFNHLLLTTGNKSEMAVGYATLYGDMCGGLAVISDVPKTTVYDLSEFVNLRAGRDVIPRNTITKPPSAELRPNQTDQDSLPPYATLDAILFRYVEEEKSAAEIAAEGFDPATVERVIRLIDRSEYKRRQAPPGIKVTSRAFGFGRRMPIAQNYQQAVPKHGEPSPTEG